MLIQFEQHLYKPWNSPSRTKYASLNGASGSEAAKTATRVLQIVDNLAYVGGQACLDVERLAYRMKAAPTDEAVRLPFSIIDDLFRVYADMCEAMYEACRKYLTATYRPPDFYFRLMADPSATDIPCPEFDSWQEFRTSCNAVRREIARATTRWEENIRLLTHELRSSLATVGGWQWLFRVGSAVYLDSIPSRWISLFEDLPSVGMDARWHLRRLGYLCSALEEAVTQPQYARVVNDLEHADLVRRQITLLIQVFSSAQSAFSIYHKFGF
ncbi:hypothetical protein FB451DRAFT_1371033 [Mycena latifolia]|nr:hypothetical protein FB451DRAFT_1371033 [Mycena latifolia]